MTVPFYLAPLDLVPLFPTIILGYYSLRMVFLSRSGRLESGWKLITFGATMLSIGVLAATLQDLSSAYSLPYLLADFISTGFNIIGIVLLMLGLRSHYRVWSLKSFKVSRNPIDDLKERA